MDSSAGPEIVPPTPVDAGIFPHQILATPDNRLVLVPARGHDATRDRAEEPGSLRVFRFQDGRLSPLFSPAPNGGYGFGPRHIDFHPTKPWLFASLERQNALSVFRMSGDDIDAARLPVATHCEHSPTIWANEKRYRERYGHDVPIAAHPEIRSAEACYLSSSFAVDLARKHGTRLHVLHLTTERELELFQPGPIEQKRITVARFHIPKAHSANHIAAHICNEGKSTRRHAAFAQALACLLVPVRTERAIKQDLARGVIALLLIPNDHIHANSCLPP